jgi:hypothetical protein
VARGNIHAPFFLLNWPVFDLWVTVFDNLLTDWVIPLIEFVAF